MRDTSFILLGAGKGKRFGKPKISLKLNNKPLYLFLINKLSNLKFIGEIILVCPKQFVKDIKKEIEKENYKLKIKVVEGGKTRCLSMEKGVKNASYNYVFIHDLARPFFSLKLLSKMREKLSEKEIIVPFYNPSDTVFYENEKIEREKIKLIHTPQATKKDLILKALQKTKRRDFPDESTLLKEVLNISPFFIKDSFFNFKITFDEDLINMQEFLNLFSFKIGFGFDSHKLVKGKGSLYIGGLSVKRGIFALGHSDGDALIHSLCDALLGVLGKGDIGDFFPDKDERWKGKSSKIFLKKIMNLFKNEGYDIINVDITILLDEPKLGEKKKKIRENLAKIMKIEPGRINIKAKTTEGLFKNFIFSYTVLTAKSTI
ncbi:MAG: 2-C-methyl-D-erythritol 2,4-cyclodiphosphate synthase [candidate division WOR-3 bacterium]